MQLLGVYICINCKSTILKQRKIIMYFPCSIFNFTLQHAQFQQSNHGTWSLDVSIHIIFPHVPSLKNDSDQLFVTLYTHIYLSPWASKIDMSCALCRSMSMYIYLNINTYIYLSIYKSIYLSLCKQTADPNTFGGTAGMWYDIIVARDKAGIWV